MRNIEIFLQTNPSGLDDAITAMQFLNDLKKVEHKVGLDISIYTSYEEFNKKKIFNTPTYIEEFFGLVDTNEEDKSVITDIVSDKSVEKADSVLSEDNTENTETVNSEGDASTIKEEGSDKDNVEEEVEENASKSDYSDNSLDSIFDKEFDLHIARKKKNPHIPVDKVIFSIFTEDDYYVEAQDTFDPALINMQVCMTGMFCRCFKVSKEDPNSYQLKEYLENEIEVPNSSAFEFDSDDALKINLLLHLLALKVLYKRYVRIQNCKVYYRNLYVGDLLNTRYSIEDLYIPDPSFPYYDIEKNYSDEEKDNYYREIFEKAITITALTYCVGDRTNPDDDVFYSISHLYEYTQVGICPNLKKRYQKAERKSGEEQYRLYKEAVNRDITLYTDFVYNMVEEDKANRATANEKDLRDNDFSIESREAYCDRILGMYHKIIAYASERDCTPENWNYIFSCYSKFLIENDMRQKGMNFIKPWIRMCEKHLDININPNYHCYYIGYNFMLSQGNTEEFITYANKYIHYCLKDTERNIWGACVDAAVDLTRYYMEKNDFNTALEKVKVAMDVFERYERDYGEDPLRRANLLSMYANIQHERALYKEALDIYFKILEIYYTAEEHNPIGIAITYNNIGNCYTWFDQFDKALENQLKAVDILTESCGEENSNLYIFYHNIANSYAGLGNKLDSERYMEMAEYIREKLYLDPIKN